MWLTAALVTRAGKAEGAGAGVGDNATLQAASQAAANARRGFSAYASSGGAAGLSDAQVASIHSLGIAALAGEIVATANEVDAVLLSRRRVTRSSAAAAAAAASSSSAAAASSSSAGEYERELRPLLFGEVETFGSHKYDTQAANQAAAASSCCRPVRLPPPACPLRPCFI